MDSRQKLWTQNQSTASRMPTTAIVVKIWTIEADQLPVHHLTSTSTSTSKSIQVEFLILTHLQPKEWRFLQKRSSKTASLMSCERSDLRNTLKYRQSRDLEVIQWIFPIYTDAAPGVNVPQSTSKWIANFQLKRSKLKVTGRQKPQEIAAYLAYMFTYLLGPNHC